MGAAQCRYEHPGTQTNYNSGNRFGALQIGAKQDAQQKYALNANDIQNDLTPGKGRPEWIFSAYGPGKNPPIQLFGGPEREHSFEEMRAVHYAAVKSGNPQQAIQAANKLYAEMETQMQTILNDIDGAIKYIIDGENQHPNIHDIINSKTVPTTSPFSQPSTAPMSSPFGAPSVLGQQQQQQQQGPFGQPSTFGQPSSLLNPFGQQASQPAVSSNPFGQAVPSPFAQAGAPFGQPSPFGQLAQPANLSPAPFGSTTGIQTGFGSTNNIPTAPAPAPFGQPSPFAKPQPTPQATQAVTATPSIGPAIMKANPNLNPIPTLTGDTRLDPMTKRLTLWKGRPVQYIDNEPCYQHPDDPSTYVRVHFPEGPPKPETLKFAVAKPEEYTPALEQAYKFAQEHKAFKDNIMPSLPPKVEWSRFDI
ncbi:hypothetical protein FQN57_001496 [Myotisia sp. PD_48]|nr:hypothetical protein FQN57_001496 [Myotisia sp. PD_48]